MAPADGNSADGPSAPFDVLLESVARRDPVAMSLRLLSRALETELDPAWCIVGVGGVDDPRLFHTDQLPPEVARLVRTYDGGRVFSSAPGTLEVIGAPTFPGDHQLAQEMIKGNMATVWLVAVGEPGSGRTIGGIVLFRSDDRPPTVAQLTLLRRYQNLAAIIAGRTHQDRQLHFDRRHDPVTGLPNRAQVVERVATALRRRGSQHLAVLSFDLDRFAAVNESLGRPAGDHVLREIGRRMRSVVRPADLVGRLDGDSFAVVCERTFSPSVAERLAQRIGLAISQAVPVCDTFVVTSASVGVALGADLEPTGPLPETSEVVAEELVLQADSAARQPGPRPGGYALYRAGPRTQSVAQLELESELRNAVAGGHLTVWYQPQVEASANAVVRSDRVVGVEALLRWPREGGAVSPDEFIPIAERVGLIGTLGLWVLGETIAALARWDGQLPANRLSAAVNLSPRQLEDPDLEATVRDLLRGSAIDPSRLTLEVTETALVHDPVGAADVLGRLKDLGLGVAIDDFGTGYASLDYLRRFPMADTLKIDRTFVDGVADPGTNDAAIVAAAVGLGRSLGLVTVAEGVETVAQAAILTEIGCHRLQGNLFSPAVPAEDIVALVGSGGNG